MNMNMVEPEELFGFDLSEWFQSQSGEGEEKNFPLLERIIEEGSNRDELLPTE